MVLRVERGEGKRCVGRRWNLVAERRWIGQCSVAWESGGDGEGVGVMIEGEGAPVSCWGVVCEGGAESAGEFARVGGGGGVGVWGECGAEESHGAGAACDGGLGDECVDADGAAGVWRDGVWCV